MLSTKLLVAVAVLIGIFAERCDMKDLGIADFADKVTITNLNGPGEGEGWVAVKTNHGKTSMILPAGKSRTVAALAATTYSIVVVGHDDDSLHRYTEQLYELRDRLQELTITPEASPDAILSAAADLALLETSLAQIGGGGQSCSGKLVTDVTVQATMKSVQSDGGTSFWVLDCG
jgi:hypothetical protein